ncbi:hypothetical protein L7F22_068521 [Adiantum nelumboides]|nr:hypothetical protein [Adiantum nelumboides]
MFSGSCRGLTHFDVDTFVDEVLVQNQVWISGRPERLTGVHIFVCSHASHDIRCGVSGPIIIRRLRNELRSRSLDADVCVRPCTHIGGHKYKANIVVYSLEVKCYASVTADDVCQLVDELFNLGVLVAGHRRSFQGRSESESMHSLHNSTQSLVESEEFLQAQDMIESYSDLRALNPPRSSFSDKGEDHRWRRDRISIHSWWQPSWWLKSWEREDTLAAFAVVGAAASVYVAYLLYRIHARR